MNIPSPLVAGAVRKRVAEPIPLRNVQSRLTPQPPLAKGGEKRISLVNSIVPMLEDEDHCFRTRKTLSGRAIDLHSWLDQNSNSGIHKAADC